MTLHHPRQHPYPILAEVLIHADTESHQVAMRVSSAERMAMRRPFNIKNCPIALSVDVIIVLHQLLAGRHIPQLDVPVMPTSDEQTCIKRACLQGKRIIFMAL